MATSTCECCGNSYDKAFTITMGDRTGTFDSFACAIHVLAPRCKHCGLTIIGHGMESEQGFFCCAHCARLEGERQLQDRT